MTVTVYNDLEQGTPKWHDLRRGIVTASTVGKLLTFESPSAVGVDCDKCKATAGSPCLSLARKTPTPISTYHPERAAVASLLPAELAVADNETSRGLVATLVAERITGQTDPTPFTDDMARGVMLEPVARDFYAEHHAPVEEVGFMRMVEPWGTLGYSPDGLVGDDGLIEIKAPRARTHLRTILADEVPPQYIAQCQAGLLVSGRKWIDFVSYVAGLPVFVKRVLPDPMWHAAIQAAVQSFEDAATALTSDYFTRVDGLPVAERIDFLEAI